MSTTSTTIQNITALAILMNNGIADLTVALTNIPVPPTVPPLLDGLTRQSAQLGLDLKQLETTLGAGSFPNTMVKQTANGPTYLIIQNAEQQVQAQSEGYLIATFPETMVKVGFPNLEVFSEIEKDDALQQGYNLPGL
jgi:hypothetical protein